MKNLFFNQYYSKILSDMNMNLIYCSESSGLLGDFLLPEIDLQKQPKRFPQSSKPKTFSRKDRFIVFQNIYYFSDNTIYIHLFPRQKYFQ
jgi:hypothetical protein